jgi:hypothetical protein
LPLPATQQTETRRVPALGSTPRASGSPPSLAIAFSARFLSRTQAYEAV